MFSQLKVFIFKIRSEEAGPILVQYSEPTSVRKHLVNKLKIEITVACLYKLYFVMYKAEIHIFIILLQCSALFFLEKKESSSHHRISNFFYLQ